MSLKETVHFFQFCSWRWTMCSCMPVSSPQADTHAPLEKLHCIPSVLQVRPVPPMRPSPLFPTLYLLWIWPAIIFLTFLGHLVLLLRNWVQSSARQQGRGSVFCVLQFHHNVSLRVFNSCWTSWILRDSGFSFILKSSQVITSSCSTPLHSLRFSPGLTLERPDPSHQFSFLPIFFILAHLKSFLTYWATLNHGLPYWAPTSLTRCFHNSSTNYLLPCPLIWGV